MLRRSLLIACCSLLATATALEDSEAGRRRPPNQAPAAPVILIDTVLSDYVEGMIGPCVDDGRPGWGSCTHEVFAVLAGAGPGAPPVSGPLSVAPGGGDWLLPGLTSGVAYDFYGRASDGAKITLSAPTTVITNTAPAAPMISITSVVSDEISGTIDLCTDDGLPVATCARMVFAVPDGAGPTATPVAGPLQVFSPNTNWTLTGLSEGSVVDVYGSASDGELETFSAAADVTTNSRPDPPTVSIPSNGSTLGINSASGTVSSCVDDGAIAPCTQEVRITRDAAITVPPDFTGSCSNTPQGQCTCTGTVVDTTTVTGGSFTSTALKGDKFYKFYPVSKDGEFEVCGSPVSRMTPLSQAGCWKSEAGVYFPLSTTNTHAASIRWAPKELLAPDELAAADGGFTLVSIITAVGDTTIPAEDPTGMTPFDPYNLNNDPTRGDGGFIESGTQRGPIPGCGTGAPGNYYFVQAAKPGPTQGTVTAQLGCQKHPITGVPYTWVPNVSPNDRFFAGSCEFAAPGFGSICVGEPSTTVFACAGTGKCQKVSGWQSVGTRFFSVGLESTCGNSSAARIVRHVITDTEYRDQNFWLNYIATTGTPYEAARVGLPTGPVVGGMAPPPDFSDPFRLRLCFPPNPQQLTGWLNDPMLVENCF